MAKTRILHIGDLHYDSSMGQQLFQQLQDEIIPTLNKNRGRYGKFDVIVSSGDIPREKPDDNLRQGFSFLNRLRIEIGAPPLVLSVGNHEVERPEIDEDFIDGKRRDVCADFITEFNRIRSKHKNMFVRPVCPGENPRIQKVRNALKTFDALGFKRHGLDKDKIDLLPFLWLRNKKVFFYTLSTVDYCASPYSKSGSDAKNIYRAITKRIKTKKTRDEILGLSLMRDISYVRRIQLDVLAAITQYLRNHRDKDVRKQFHESVKIAVFHHPLVLLPDEAEINEFDWVANGPYVAAELSSLGFSIFLYGHKHYERTSINLGSSDPDSVVNTGEFVSLCGARFFSAAGRTQPLIQVVEIENKNEGQFSERIVSVRKLRISPPQLSDPVKIASFGKDGKPRWLHFHERGLIARQHRLSEMFNKLVVKVEDSFRSTIESNWTRDYDSADAFLAEFMDFLEGYCRGTYGLNTPFISRLQTDLDTADALYFIDLLESPAWAHPSFMHHLALQMKAYTTRNHKQLRSRIWSHSDPVEVALQKLKCHRSQRTTRISKGKVSRPPEELDLDICRILIWDEEKLKTICGRILIALHEIFQIPLLHLGKQFSTKHFKKLQLKEERDFHLILKGKNKRGEFYDETKKDRIKISDARPYLGLYEDLLKDDNLDLAVRRAGLEK